MNKSFPYIANSILFIIGMFGVWNYIWDLTAVCILLMSLLFLWCYGITSGKLEDMKNDDTSNEFEQKNLIMSNRIKELVENNHQLVSENDNLKQRINQLANDKKKVEMPKRCDWYDFPVRSAVPIDINDFLKLYIENNRISFNNAKISVEYSCQSMELFTFLSESALLTVCNNVFDNILKFAPVNSRVFVMVSESEDDCLVIFKNPGKGIPESENGRIFDINYKGSNTICGNGLGLTQVKRIMDEYGARIWGKSTTDTGFALYMQIPKH